MVMTMSITASAATTLVRTANTRGMISRRRLAVPWLSLSWPITLSPHHLATRSWWSTSALWYVLISCWGLVHVADNNDRKKVTTPERTRVQGQTTLGRLGGSRSTRLRICSTASRQKSRFLQARGTKGNMRIIISSVHYLKDRNLHLHPGFKPRYWPPANYFCSDNENDTLNSRSQFSHSVVANFTRVVSWRAALYIILFFISAFIRSLGHLFFHLKRVNWPGAHRTWMNSTAPLCIIHQDLYRRTAYWQTMEGSNPKYCIAESLDLVLHSQNMPVYIVLSLKLA
jgi:hypothetical protein